MLERRRFLTTLSATVLAAALPASSLAALQIRTGERGSLQKHFAQFVDTDFRLFDSEGIPHKARLVAIDEGPRCPGLEQFSVVFEGSDLSDGLYQIRSWRTGRICIGLQSSGEPGTAINRQRACFSNFVWIDRTMPTSMDIAEINDVSLFTEFVGDKFRIEIGPDEFAESTLIEAEASRHGAHGNTSPVRQPFSLLFDLRGDADLPQQNYMLCHEKLGKLILFLVPVGRGRMESIFN
jgi:hypothetical protein